MARRAPGSDEESGHLANMAPLAGRLHPVPAPGQVYVSNCRNGHGLGYQARTAVDRQRICASDCPPFVVGFAALNPESLLTPSLGLLGQADFLLLDRAATVYLSQDTRVAGWVGAPDSGPRKENYLPWSAGYAHGHSKRAAHLAYQVN